MATTLLEDFMVSLGFAVNTDGLKKFEAQTESLKMSALKIGALFTGAAAGIGLLVEGVANSMADLADFAELNDMSARSVAALGKIAIENDSTMEGMNSTIQSLSASIGEAALGVGKGAQLFKKFGLEAKNADGSIRNVDDLLSDVADKMQGLSRQEQIAMAKKLGIDAQLVKTLEKGSESLKALREEAEAVNPFSEKDYQMAQQVNKLFVKAKETMGVFTKMLGVSLMPVVKEVLEIYLEWFRVSRKVTGEFMTTGLGLLAIAVRTVWEWFFRLVTGVKKLIEYLGQFKLVVYASIAALGMFIALQVYGFAMKAGAAIALLTAKMFALNASAMLIPAVIGAIIAAFALLIDDFIGWKAGNDSFIGDMVAQFPWLLDVIEGIEKAVGQLVDFWLAQWQVLKPSVTALWSSLMKVVSVLWTNLFPVIKVLFGVWIAALTLVIPYIANIVEWLAEKLVKAIAFVVDTITWLLEVGISVFQGLVSAIQWVGDAFWWLLALVPRIFNGIASIIKLTISWIVGAFKWMGGIALSVYDFVAEKVLGVVELVSKGATVMIDAVLMLLQDAKQFVLGFYDTVANAVKDVGSLLGLTATADIKTVQQGGEQQKGIAPLVADSLASIDKHRLPLTAYGAAGLGASTVANNAPPSTSVVQTTAINGVQISVNSPDPEKAGASVRKELERMNKQVTTNGLSAVTL